MKKAAAIAAATAAALVGNADALLPAKVNASLCDAAAPATSWTVHAPSSTAPSTPRFDLTLSSEAFAGASQQHFELHGSLGIPNHPLGVFAFDANGSACGPQASISPRAPPASMRWFALRFTEGHAES